MSPVLEINEKVVFYVNGDLLPYTVMREEPNGFFLDLPVLSNDRVFDVLGFNHGGKINFCHAFGSNDDSGMFPYLPTLESLTICVNELHRLCANPDLLQKALAKYNRPKSMIADKAAITDAAIEVIAKKPRKFKVGDLVKNVDYVGWYGIVVSADVKGDVYKCYWFGRSSDNPSTDWETSETIEPIKKVRKDKKEGR